MMDTKPHKQSLNNTRHIRANPQFIIIIIHFIYLLFMYVHLNSQSSEDTSRENDTFSRILSFCMTTTFGTKYKVCGECGWCFYVRFSDRRCAGQWIYKGTSAFKNIKKETFPTQTDQ